MGKDTSSFWVFGRNSSALTIVGRILSIPPPKHKRIDRLAGGEGVTRPFANGRLLQSSRGVLKVNAAAGSTRAAVPRHDGLSARRWARTLTQGPPAPQVGFV